MTIRGDRVGIGTLQPGAKLHVQGNVRLEGIEELSQATGARVLLIDNQGYVKRGQLSLVGDNLGNHIATQNIKLGNYWLSNDGSNYGIRLNSLGDVLISGRVASGHEKGLSENNGFEVVTRGRVPERRGISLDDDPSGNVNFWIHNWQNPAAFNFMRNDAGSTKKLCAINKSGDLYIMSKIGVGTEQPQERIHIFESTNQPVFIKVQNQNSIISFGLDGAHGIINSSRDLMLNWYSNKNVIVGGEQSGDFSTLHNTYLAVNSGKVGIGTTNPQNELDVNGTIHCKLFKVDITDWYDNVFENTYNLMSFEELRKFILQNKHLPEIPTEDDVIKNGLDVGKMNALLLKKVEELTLYILMLENEINEIKTELNK